MNTNVMVLESLYHHAIQCVSPVSNFLSLYFWIYVKDPLQFLACGIPYIRLEGSFLLPRVMWAKIRLASACRRP